MIFWSCWIFNLSTYLKLFYVFFILEKKTSNTCWVNMIANDKNNEFMFVHSIFKKKKY